MKPIRRVEPRYLEHILYGTRWGDELPTNPTWHQRFNWMCNVCRDVRLYGGGSTMKHFVKVNLELLRKDRNG